MEGDSAGEYPLDVIVAPPEEAAAMLVDELAALASVSDRPLAIGVATGRTPVGVYAQWVRRARCDAPALGRIAAFNLDEFVGIAADQPHTCASYLRTHLGAPLGLARDAVRVPDARDPAAYERDIDAAGGIALQILGIGRNGHLGFNEPGSARDSRTRIVDLAPTTREDAAQNFGCLARVPTRGVTVGIATILAARRLRLLAFGAGKRAIVARLLHEPVHAGLPASWLRCHPDARLYVDADALGGART